MVMQEVPLDELCEPCRQQSRKERGVPENNYILVQSLHLQLSINKSRQILIKLKVM